jgi:hypothetical protein
MMDDKTGVIADDKFAASDKMVVVYYKAQRSRRLDTHASVLGNELHVPANAGLLFAAD